MLFGGICLVDRWGPALGEMRTSPKAFLKFWCYCDYWFLSDLACWQLLPAQRPVGCQIVFGGMRLHWHRRVWWNLATGWVESFLGGSSFFMSCYNAKANNSGQGHWSHALSTKRQTDYPEGDCGTVWLPAGPMVAKCAWFTCLEGLCLMRSSLL